MGMTLRLAAAFVALAALIGCGNDETLRAEADVAPDSPPAQSAVPASVELWHCGVLPATVEGRLWEAPAQMVDGDSTLPLDATNTPADWAGKGTALVDADQMTYTDAGGEVVDFVPDDGVAPTPCA